MPKSFSYCNEHLHRMQIFYCSAMNRLPGLFAKSNLIYMKICSSTKARKSQFSSMKSDILSNHAAKIISKENLTFLIISWMFWPPSSRIFFNLSGNCFISIPETASRHPDSPYISPDTAHCLPTTKNWGRECWSSWLARRKDQRTGRNSSTTCMLLPMNTSR